VKQTAAGLCSTKSECGIFEKQPHVRSTVVLFINGTYLIEYIYACICILHVDFAIGGAASLQVLPDRQRAMNIYNENDVYGEHQISNVYGCICAYIMHNIYDSFIGSVHVALCKCKYDSHS
jgi:hypothetical protein